MHRRFAMITGGALVATGLGFAAASARSAEPPRSVDQRRAAPAPQKAAAVPMAVYKSPT